LKNKTDIKFEFLNNSTPNIINLNFYFFVNKVVKWLVVKALVCLHEVLFSNLYECVHQCILYKCNVWMCIMANDIKICLFYKIGIKINKSRHVKLEFVTPWCRKKKDDFFEKNYMTMWHVIPRHINLGLHITMS
jgi:hypothetical protein